MHKSIPTLAIGAASLLLGAQAALANPPQFNRDIRPILSDNCFQCHGPDAAKRQAELRLDVEAVAKEPIDGRSPIAPGQLSASEVYRRITSDDPSERMPPADSGKSLTPEQTKLIGDWIAAGAAWEPHWAFLPPVARPAPAVNNRDWPRNPIDSFILARIEAEGLAPSAEAERTTLLRRLALDLTGLPPTPDEVDAYLADHSPDVYERLVDRLLASPRYGERMAAPWLDAARYADTSGYQTDGVRYMWRWRDWVIDALNANMPFDQFTIEQLAGDMLAGATLDQRIATGFNRNHRGNAEGGIIPEEYAVEYVVDRVDTTATVWLGLTVGCARCHDHKFDPISQREYYQLFAYFNNVPERGRAIKVGNSPPMVKAPTRDEQRQLDEVDRQLADARRALGELEPQIEASVARWAGGFQTSAVPIHWAPREALAVHLPLDGDLRERVTDKPAELSGAATFAEGKLDKGLDCDGALVANAGDVAKFGYFDKFTISAWIMPRAADGTILARMNDPGDLPGYTIQLAGGKLQVNLINRWLDDALRVETEQALSVGQWQHVAVTYDGTRLASGVQVYVDGRPAVLKVLLDELNQTFASTDPLRIGGGGPGPRFNGRIDEVRIYQAPLPPESIELLATPEAIDAIVARSAAERTKAQAAKLRAYYLDAHAAPVEREAVALVAERVKRREALEEGFATTMVMEETPEPRQSYILARGQYDKPTEAVAPGLPASLSAGAEKAGDRLALARWLVDGRNPLVARVAVNRVWQSLFGAGLVRTADDFGAQGDPPSHVELLDWLAVRLVDSGWDTKALMRDIVTSATYRQSSVVTPVLAERDPENRLLARGPRQRLRAEVIRDSALAASGLLVEHVGGPSVHPYQPPGLWKELTGAAETPQDHGASLYRRSLYTFWKRTIAPPSMMTFDAAGREACTVRETRTNTPLQALTLMNEVTFVEAARQLAARAMREGGSQPDERIRRMFRLAVVREPSPAELQVLGGMYVRQLSQLRGRPESVAKLLAVGESPAGDGLDHLDLAAYTTVANTILNLDEIVNKE